MAVDLFTTTPQSVNYSRAEYIQELKRIVNESEANDYLGTLIYSDNRLTDPWVVADWVIQNTEELLPMIALQPVYMHPYTVAKKISSMGLLYGRRIALNLISGGFKKDLESLGDNTEHDKRYDRLREYTQIITQLLSSDQGVTFEGEFYNVHNLKLQPSLPEELMPILYLSGSSDAARQTAIQLDAKLLEYPEPSEYYLDPDNQPEPPSTGVRLGVLARPSHDAAWEVARKRFPNTRQGQMTHKLAKATSDSEWHQRLSEHDKEEAPPEPVYWLGPFQHYHTFCPYMVGDYKEVSSELAGYLGAGYNTFILDIPVSESELKHTRHVFEQAESQLQSKAL